MNSILIIFQSFKFSATVAKNWFLSVLYQLCSLLNFVFLAISHNGLGSYVRFEIVI